MKGKLRYGDTIIPYSIIQTKRKKTMQIFIEKDKVEVIAPESKNLSEISEEQKKILNRVVQRLDGHLTMISNLLDLSRIEAGRLVQQKERIILPKIIEEVVELMAPEAEKKGLTFKVTLDSRVFPIYADYQSMETVFNNEITKIVGNQQNSITNPSYDIQTPS